MSIGYATVTKTVAFEKYSQLGNTFLVVDETRTPLCDDLERAGFARWALDEHFGVGGADNVIYLARQSAEDSFTFRIFEQDGAETLSCGNGLLSAAAALARIRPDGRWPVFTELPTGLPRLVSIGVDPASGEAWADMGWPRAVPPDLYPRSRPFLSDGVGVVDGLRVPLPQDQHWSSGLPPMLRLSGWLVFTGEPHLVVVLGDGLPAELAGRLFPAPDGHHASNALVDHLGRYVNNRYRTWFPHGVHLDFVRDTGAALEYRTWERAIDKETLACGTGALACAYICRARHDSAAGRISLWPYRCRWHQPGAALTVTCTPGHLLLSGRPAHVYSGSIPFQPILLERST